MSSLSTSSAAPSSTGFRLERVELYELTLPLLEPFIISGGTMTHRRSLVVIVHDDQGNRGMGESPPFELPFYSERNAGGRPPSAGAGVDPPPVAGQARLIPRRPTLLLHDGIRGNRFARAAVDTALWDLEAAAAGYRTGSGSRRPARRRVLSRHRLRCGPGHPGGPIAPNPPPVDRAGNPSRLSPGQDQDRAGMGCRPNQSGSGDHGRLRFPLTVDANGAYQWPEHESRAPGSRPE